MDYGLIFPSLYVIIMSWGRTPKANSSMVLKIPCLNCKADLVGKSARSCRGNPMYSSSDGNFDLWSEELNDVMGREKCRNQIIYNPYRQPTQVNKSSRLRRAGEPFLRNSANYLGVTSGEALPHSNVRSQRVNVGGLFNKNTGLCKLERGSIWAEACPVPEG